MSFGDSCGVDGEPSHNFQTKNWSGPLSRIRSLLAPSKQTRQGGHHGVARHGLRMEGYEVLSEGFLLVNFAVFLSHWFLMSFQVSYICSVCGAAYALLSFFV